MIELNNQQVTINMEQRQRLLGRAIQTRLEIYTNQADEIKNRGYLDSEKRQGMTRLLNININGFQSNHNEKITQLTQFYIKYQVDIIIITELNIKWTTKSCDSIKGKLKSLGWILELIVADSKAYTIVEKDWLQGGTVMIIIGNILTLIQNDDIKIDKLGR